jgi:spore germination cell wall hydrolase CwlJ-like protein
MLVNNDMAVIKKSMIIDEAMVAPPPIHFTPPAMVQKIDTPKPFNVYHADKEQQKQNDTVVACIILEAGGEGKKGMEAVNEVLHNRAAAQHKSLYQIATAPLQFSCFNNGVDAAVVKAKKHPNWNIALNILNAQLTNHTHGAKFYHTLNSKPKWAPILLKRGAKIVIIGHHKFYYNYGGN